MADEKTDHPEPTRPEVPHEETRETGARQQQEIIREAWGRIADHLGPGARLS